MIRFSSNLDKIFEPLKESTEIVDEDASCKNSDLDLIVSLENQIINAVERNHNYIISKVVVEFLTVNVYAHIKNLKRNEILKDVDSQWDSDMQVNLNDLEKIEKQTARQMSTCESITEITAQINNLFGSEIEKLIETVTDLVKNNFFKIFTNLDLIKFRLKIGTFSSNYEKRKNLSDKRTSIESDSDFSYDGDFRLFGKCLITKIFFPTLVYKADMEKSYNYKLFNLLISDSSILNKTLKSLIGLAATCLLTYAIFLYMKHIAQIKAPIAAVLIIIFFLVLSFGLVFDNAKFRCIILLIIPFMASSRGRAIILMNCYSLCTIHVLPNALDNVDILQETYKCNKKIMNEQTRSLMRTNSAYQDFQEKVNYMRQAKENVANSLDTVKKVMHKNVQYINKSYHYLKKIEAMNIDLFGNVSTNCTFLMRKMYEGCSDLRNMMSTTAFYFFQGLRYYFFLYITSAEISFKLYCRKLLNLACPSFDSIKAPFKQAKTYYRNLKKDLKSEIEQRVNSLKNEFEFEVIEKEENVTREKKFKKKFLTVAQIYRNRLDTLNTYLIGINFIFPISFLFLIYSAFKFHSKYVKRDNFNNYIIGVKFYEIDHNRKLKKQPSVLPLNPLIKINYTELFSISLTKNERHLTINSVINLTLLLIPVFFSVLFEEFIVAVNQYIYSNTHVNIEYSDQDNSKIVVKNDGFLGSTYRQLFRMFYDQEDVDIKMDNKKCLPRLVPADQSVRQYILYSILVLYFLAIFQAYIKRLRFFLSGCVYPDRDMERANWLYTKLLALYSSIGLIERKKEKENFWLKFFKNCLWTIASCVYTVLMLVSFYYCFGTVERVGLKSIIRKYKVKFMPIYLKYFPPKFEYCLTCLAQPGDQFSPNDFLKCDSQSCTGFYCIDCFIFLDNNCKICQRTICNRVNMIDETVEQDSSDDDADDGNKNDANFNTKQDNYFKCKKDVVKITDDLVKIKILNFDKERAMEIINSCFKLLYFELKDLIDDELFLHAIENSESLKKIFTSDMQLVHDMVKLVVENYVIYLTIDDCFTKDEIDNELLNKKRLKSKFL